MYDSSAYTLQQWALYKAKTELMTIQKYDQTATFIVRLPESFEMQQSRNFYRVKMDKEAKITYKEGGEPKTVSCKIYDLSASGVRLIFDEKQNIVDNVNIELVFDNKTFLFNAKPIKYFNNNLQISFKFINLSEKDSDYISSVCFKKQLADISKKRKRL